MTHQPRGRHFEEFKVGETFQSQGRTINPPNPTGGSSSSTPW